MGRVNEARTVQLARQRRRRRTLPRIARVWGFVQRWMVEYGCRPLRAGLWPAALLIAAGWVLATTIAAGACSGSDHSVRAVARHE